jgi:hypothetical protein
MIHIISAVLKHDKARSIWVSLKDSMTVTTSSLNASALRPLALFVCHNLWTNSCHGWFNAWSTCIQLWESEWSTIKLKSMCIYICIYPIIIPLLLALPPWLLVNYSPTIFLWYIHIYSLFINCQSLNPILLSLCSLIPSSVGPPHKINPPKAFH